MGIIGYLEGRNGELEVRNKELEGRIRELEGRILQLEQNEKGLHHVRDASWTRFVNLRKRYVQSCAHHWAYLSEQLLVRTEFRRWAYSFIALVAAQRRAFLSMFE